jgi:hypothetical protein
MTELPYACLYEGTTPQIKIKLEHGRSHLLTVKEAEKLVRDLMAALWHAERSNQ